MLNKKSTIIFSLLALFLCQLLPSTILAAQTSFSLQTESVRRGDVVVAELSLRELEQTINAMDGYISFDPNFLKVEDVSIGDSVFTLWPRTPVFSNDNGRIIFTGGIPGGLKNTKGKVLRIVFLAKNTGDTSIAVTDESVLYLNDGQGTKVSPHNIALDFSIAEADENVPTQNNWNEQLVNDKTGPENLIVQLGRDASIFDGRYFISFFAQDKETGIDHYEVKEGEKDFAYSESPYILNDQQLKSKVFVKAIDKAGNATIVEFKTKVSFYAQPWFAILVTLLLVAGIIWKLKRKKIK